MSPIIISKGSPAALAAASIGLSDCPTNKRYPALIDKQKNARPVKAGRVGRVHAGALWQTAAKKETPAGGCRGFSETMMPEGVTLQGRSYARVVVMSSGG